MSFSITILGSSAALPALGRFPTSQYVIIGKHHFLIDAGEGVQMQMAKFGVSTNKIDAIFISHLHGDHYLGLIGLLFTMHLNKRTTELHLYSFKGLSEIILLQLKYSRSVLSFDLIFHDLKENTSEIIFDSSILFVKAFPLKHKIPCCGFLFREKQKPRRINKAKMPPNIMLQHIALLKQGEDIFDELGKLIYKNEDYTLAPRHSRSYAFCSDTMYDEEIINEIIHIDLLYHEATFLAEDSDKAKLTWHSTAQEAAQIASLAKVKRLLIGHFSARYHSTELLLKESRRTFSETYLANEGETFNIEE